MGDISPTPFGVFLREEREQAGLSLREFGKLVGRSPAYLSRVERMLERPRRHDLLCAIADALNIPRDRVYAHAGVLPADIQDDMFLVISLYREYVAGNLCKKDGGHV